jgi:hypothetical protein
LKRTRMPSHPLPQILPHYLPTAMHFRVYKLVLQLLMVLSFLSSNFVAWMVALLSRTVDPLVGSVNSRNALLSVLAKLRFAQLMPLLKRLLTSAIFAGASPKWSLLLWYQFSYNSVQQQRRLC